MTTHPLAQPRPTFDIILRTRLTALIALGATRNVDTTGFTVAARAAGWTLSTLYRRLHLDPDDSGKYRRLHANAVDELLVALSNAPDDVLQPVLTDDDRKLLNWVGLRTPSDPLPSRALYRQLAEVPITVVHKQGLIDICGDPDDKSTWYLRLTPAGQRALR